MEQVAASGKVCEARDRLFSQCKRTVLKLGGIDKTSATLPEPELDEEKLRLCFRFGKILTQQVPQLINATLKNGLTLDASEARPWLRILTA